VRQRETVPNVNLFKERRGRQTVFIQVDKAYLLRGAGFEILTLVTVSAVF
jgi:hypothetical protein